MKKYFFVDFNHYMGSGTVRELELAKDCPHVRKERAGVYIYQNRDLGLSRVLYTSKNKAEIALLYLEQD
jgi:hypothetical protein